MVYKHQQFDNGDAYDGVPFYPLANLQTANDACGKTAFNYDMHIDSESLIPIIVRLNAIDKQSVRA